MALCLSGSQDIFEDIRSDAWSMVFFSKAARASTAVDDMNPQASVKQEAHSSTAIA